MLCSVAGSGAGPIDRAAARGGSNPVSGQGSTFAGARSRSRLGAGVVGRTVSRAGLQAQLLADAGSRRISGALGDAAALALRPAGAVVRHQRPVAGGIDPRPDVGGWLPAAGLGSM